MILSMIVQELTAEGAEFLAEVAEEIFSAKTSASLCG